MCHFHNTPTSQFLEPTPPCMPLAPLSLACSSLYNAPRSRSHRVPFLARTLLPLTPALRSLTYIVATPVPIFHF